MTGSRPTLCPARADSESTLHHGVRRLHRGQVGDDSDIIVPAGAFNVDVDGALNLAVQARHHACGVCHVRQATLAVVPERWDIAGRVTGQKETRGHMKPDTQKLSERNKSLAGLGCSFKSEHWRAAVLCVRSQLNNLDSIAILF